ncbi:MAG: hypothetical protein RLZZ511_1855 [Cyanobacteriota bacterium]|jgi:hypothetical protein
MANLTATCAFDTNSGKPNPLGMRAYITAVEIGGDTTFSYEQFPSNINGEKDGPATIAVERKLVFYKTSISRARALMLKNSAYYESLIGTRDEAGFAAVNAVLRCQGADGQPLDKSGKAADLPDGTYRFWSGNARDAAISDEELLKQGGVLVIFTKKGDRVIGNAGQIDGEAGVCLEGTLGGNTISGFATTYGPMKTFNQTDNFEPLSVIPDGALRVRRGQKFGSGRARFTSALYNLNGYSKINLDDSKAPKSCK